MVFPVAEGPRPSVLIVGGFATAPIGYWTLRRRLLRRGAQRVDICGLWPPDWALAGIVGFGPILRRTGRAIGRTYRAGGRRPIIVVGHSAGGIATRLAMSDVPFEGRLAGVAEAVACLVTLGTPHGLGALSNRHQHAGHDAVAFLERECPGAFHQPRTSYLTVGARNSAGRYRGPHGHALRRGFNVIVGGDVEQDGDGIVPVSAAHLEGARQITLEGVGHGMMGGRWYGDEYVIDEWWPTAVELWRAALDARVGAPRSPTAVSSGATDDRRR